MKLEERIQMFRDVFAPKSGERVLFLVDMPHEDIKDNKSWKARRKMAKDWYKTFRKMGSNEGFSVEMMKYDATGQQNAPIPELVIDEVRKSNLVIAMTEYSATSSLKPICHAEGSITRCASMPGVEKRMEKTAFKADYVKVKKYAIAIERMLNEAVGAQIKFSNGDKLYIDLRHRNADADKGECTEAGQAINFPSGEAFKAPYEAVPEEIEESGVSKTRGILPAIYDGEIVRYLIINNRIIGVEAKMARKREINAFFNENASRRNIAELGIGCNPNAVVTGNVLEDEKVGLHIAYGTSMHLGGKVKSDVHQDIVYTKRCPIEGETLTLINKDDSKTELIRDAKLRYELLV